MKHFVFIHKSRKIIRFSCSQPSEYGFLFCVRNYNLTCHSTESCCSRRCQINLNLGCFLRPPAGAWAVPRQKVSGALPLQESGGGSHRVSGAIAPPAGAARGQAGVHPFRHPVRLSAGGQGRVLFQGTGGAPCQRAAEGGAG